jgi:FKBP-type peptidyl-prolyl cis-trans isomerase FkpA/FKBP-type peptidyl-prolyl cis-trans isomerase FklB
MKVPPDENHMNRRAGIVTPGRLEDNSQFLFTDRRLFREAACWYFTMESKAMKQIYKMGALITVVLLTGNVLATELETEAQKLGYIIGMDIGTSLKQQGAELDLDALFDAIRDTYNGEALALTPEEAATVREAFIAKRRAEAEAQRQSLGADNAVAGDKFLLENRIKEGVELTESGLQYKVLKMGDGAKPAATDKVTVHYRGTLLDGQEFDSSYARNQPMSFQLNQVIPGWTEGVQLMPVGSKFMFYIPPNLAYGPNGQGPIGPNSTLIFEVELLGIE